MWNDRKIEINATKQIPLIANIDATKWKSVGQSIHVEIDKILLNVFIC